MVQRSLSLVRSLMSAGAAGASRSSSGLSSGYASRVLRPVLARRDGEVLLPTAETVRGSGVRHFGVMDKIQDKMERRNVNQQETEFKRQMMELSELDKFDLNDFAKIIEEPLQKWTAKMPWNSGREELLTMQKQKKLMDAMTPAQRSDPSLIRERHKKSIADRADCTMEEVHDLLYKFREMRGMHLWLRERRERNQKIPASTDEMAPLIADKDGVPLIKFMKKKAAKSGLGISYSF